MLDLTTTQDELLYRLQPELLQTHFKPPAGQGAPLLMFPFIRGLQGTVLSRLLDYLLSSISSLAGLYYQEQHFILAVTTQELNMRYVALVKKYFFAEYSKIIGELHTVHLHTWAGRSQVVEDRHRHCLPVHV